MSRTFRRKNYEITQGTSWDRQGRKIAGFYNDYDFVEKEGFYTNYGNKVYFALEGKKFFEKYWRIHGESRSAQDWSPGKSYRKPRIRENRSITRQELHKFMKNPDSYEPMVEANPRSCWWDWS